MRLSQIIYESRIKLDIPAQYQDSRKEVEIAAKMVANKPWGDETKFYGARWKLQLDSINDSYSEIIYKFSVIPITGNQTTKATEWGGERKTFDYREPINAIEEIDEQPGMVYRGMSMEEWINSKRNGYLQSAGTHNLDQDGLTFYGSAQTATYYASGFAPVSFKPGRQKPGVIVEINKKHVMDHTQHHRIPHSEYAHTGGVPISEISRIWFLVPTSIKPGRIEIIKDYRGYREGSRFDPSVEYRLIRQQ